MTRHTVRPRHLVATAVAAVALAVPLGPFKALLLDAESTAQKCLILATWHNDVRRVGRPVNVECTPPHSWDGHRGNWGVDSGVSRPQDGFQFAGWDRKDGWLTGQSCTRNYPTPDPANYNDPQTGYTSQRAHPDNERAYGYQADRGDPGVSCESLNRGVYTFLYEHMALYELDSPDPDDHVGTLYYGHVSVPVDCDSAWDCSGSSGWCSPAQPQSADNASADIEIRVFLF